MGFQLLALFRERAQEFSGGLQLFGVDNLSRPGSEWNRPAANRICDSFFHGDLRSASDLEALPEMDWVIDASANASVQAGQGNATSSRQLIESNLLTTVNILEFCKTRRAGMVLISSSRVYSIDAQEQLTLAQTLEDGGGGAMAVTLPQVLAGAPVR